MLQKLHINPVEGLAGWRQRLESSHSTWFYIFFRLSLRSFLSRLTRTQNSDEPKRAKQLESCKIVFETILLCSQAFGQMRNGLGKGCRGKGRRRQSCESSCSWRREKIVELIIKIKVPSTNFRKWKSFPFLRLRCLPEITFRPFPPLRRHRRGSGIRPRDFPWRGRKRKTKKSSLWRQRERNGWEMHNIWSSTRNFSSVFNYFEGLESELLVRFSSRKGFFSLGFVNIPWRCFCGPVVLRAEKKSNQWNK